MSRRFYIQTVGCQMNMLDSELVAAELLCAGYQQVANPRAADVILFNTCSVRQHAEDKIYSALGRLTDLKKRQPGTIIGVMGCMAQKDQQEILRRAPQVDLVVGPGQLGRLTGLLERIAGGSGPMLEVSLDRTAGTRASVAESFVPFSPLRTAFGGKHQAMVRIIFGCDKFCTYCVVPRVRGPEQNRPAAEIIDEVRRLADDGCLEVTLLGQTVNSYKDTTGPRTIVLADLLAMLHEIEGLRRLKFVTNYPNHMTDDLLAAVRDLPKISPYLHVPAQSGADTVLRRMKRGYTAALYRDMLARIRAMIPHAAVTSDFIVGFCGETEEEFAETMALVRDARFKNSFVFKYSARPGTRAAERYADDVPEAVKRRRNNELLALQTAISFEDNQPLLGRAVEILIEGPSKVAKKKGEGRRGKGEDGNTVAGTGHHARMVGVPLLHLESASAHSANGTPSPHSADGTRSVPATDSDIVQLVGRTVTDHIVVFDGPLRLTGQILPVTIERVEAFTLFGTVGRIS
jgi:tRNA-2-methylthio-N6-dimethylallyladenosine synthase